ncbi:MAG: thiamine phosphate synthase [bacterium]
MKKNIRGVHVLLGASAVLARSVEDLAVLAIRGGASVIQLREKNMAMDQFIPVAKRVRAICREITFIINDRVDVAKIVHADGVHLGQDDLPIASAMAILGEDAIIGMSCGSVNEAIEAEKSGASYIGFGHMYPTNSKVKATPPKSLIELSAACSSVSIPVIAIGGINLLNVEPLFSCGVSGVAILSAFSQAQNPEQVLYDFVRNFQ